MLTNLTANLRQLCSRLPWPLRRRPRTRIAVATFRKPSNRFPHPPPSASVHPNNDRLTGAAQLNSSESSRKTIRIATLNASLFSMALAAPPSESTSFESRNEGFFGVEKPGNGRLRGILKRPSLLGISSKTSEALARSKLRVSIDLPDNEISRQLSFVVAESCDSSSAPSSGGTLGGCRSQAADDTKGDGDGEGGGEGWRRSRRTVAEVLREVDADILALQDVKAEEEKEMKPLSDLAAALGMNYVFAESWAPQYGNAVLSKWPIKRWRVQKIFDDTDFRNVLKATIDVPMEGEVNFHCTNLDHLDENWRMKQVNAIVQCSDEPHILAGGLNSFDESDYSIERWSDIVKYHEDKGKPTPKGEVMRLLKGKRYIDAKDCAGDCEPVVIIAKGQSVQGTCKYGTRVDYILASPDSPFKFVPGSYSVLSSKGTSDHQIVKVEIRRTGSEIAEENVTVQRQHSKLKLLGIDDSCASFPPRKKPALLTGMFTKSKRKG